MKSAYLWTKLELRFFLTAFNILVTYEIELIFSPTYRLRFKTNCNMTFSKSFFSNCEICQSWHFFKMFKIKYFKKENSFIIVSRSKSVVHYLCKSKKSVDLDDTFERYWVSKIDQNWWILYEVSCFLGTG